MSDEAHSSRERVDWGALVEHLAALEHERWSHWQRYVHAQCLEADDGSLTIPATLVRRWSEQIATPYEELSEAEKESDREQVRRYLPILQEALGREPPR